MTEFYFTKFDSNTWNPYHIVKNNEVLLFGDFTGFNNITYWNVSGIKKVSILKYD